MSREHRRSRCHAPRCLFRGASPLPHGSRCALQLGCILGHWQGYIPPWCTRPEHRIEPYDEDPHAGHDSDLGKLSSPTQCLIPRFERWVMFHRHSRPWPLAGCALKPAPTGLPQRSCRLHCSAFEVDHHAALDLPLEHLFENVVDVFDRTQRHLRHHLALRGELEGFDQVLPSTDQ